MAESKSEGTVQAVRQLQEDQQLSDNLQAAVADGIAGQARVFNTHSVALARKLNAEAEGYKSQVADIDAKIQALQDERTDLMLAYSMLSAAAGARERGQ